MKKIAGFLINHRYIMLTIMLALAVLCGILAVNVPINNDRTKYLSDDSNMKHGLEIMDSDFSETDDASTIRVMFDDLPAEQVSDVKARLKAIPDVSGVKYEADSEKYNKDDHKLFIVTTSFDYGSDEEKAIEEAIKTGFPEYKTDYQNNDIPATEVPAWLLITALSLAVIILLIMSRSWIEPVLFLITIGIAVVINFGTNIFLPYIDEMTATVGPILQFVLSMDYSIILMNRYRQEKEKSASKFDAMKAALAGSVSSIASSSLTTVVGLLALVFLSFKLGPELGIVLAKGVFISMLCVFTILPVLILAADKWLEKTRKKSLRIPTGFLAKISYKARYAMPAVFAVLLVVSFILQNSTAITYMEKNEDTVSGIFPRDNTVVVVYNNKDEARVNNIVSELEKNKRISSVLGYTNTLGKKMDADEMCEAFDELGGDMDISRHFVNMIYCMEAGVKTPSLTVSQFMNFITDSILPDEAMNSYIDDDLREEIAYYYTFSDKAKLTAPMTAGEMADFFGIEKESIEQLYLYYTIQNGVKDSGTMTLPAFVDFVLNDVAKDETYGAMFDKETLSSLRQLQTFTDKNTVQSKRASSELASMLGIDENMVKTVFVLHNAQDVNGRKMSISAFSDFLCNNIMKNELFASYFDDAAKAQAQKLNGLILLAGSGQTLSAEQMAQTLGMDKADVSGLYYLYFSNDPAFNREVAAMKMPLTDFLALLKANSSGAEKDQLAKTESLINLALSKQALDAQTMAGITGMDVTEISYIYMMNSAQTMTLPDFLNAALQLAPGNVKLQQMNNLIQLAVSGTPLDALTLASAFGIEQAQVYQLFGAALAAQKTIAFADFTNFLVNSVLTNTAYAGSFTPEQTAQLKQMNSIAQLAVSGQALDPASLAKVFGMDESMATTLFRLYFGADISGKTMSLEAFVNFILSDPVMNGMTDKASAGQLRFAQSVINASLNNTAFSSAKLAGLLGMDASQAEQLYILRMYKNGAEWTLSPRTFVNFAVTDVLNNKAFSKYFDAKSAEDLKSGQTLIEAVVSGKAYNSSEMYDFISSLTDEATKNDIVVLYLYYVGVKNNDPALKMTIPQFFTYLNDELLNDERFTSYFDDETIAEVTDGKADVYDAVAQLKGDTYSRLIITSDYPDESAGSQAYIENLNTLCKENLGEYYLAGNSVMVNEMDETFDREYLMITLITAIAIFLVVLCAFRNPTMPLILTLIVQCGVFITVSIIGAYSGAIYYLALLIVQSILMGATIDYGIVFCNFYKESRKTMEITEALKAAYEGSIHTIMTSGSILVLVLAALGIFTSSAMTAEVCITLSIGVLIAILLILFVLPGMVTCCDRLICRKPHKAFHALKKH